MSIAEKLTQIAENEQRVYEAGCSKAELDFWKGFTNNGKRQSYLYAFLNCNFSGKTIPEGLCKPYSRLTQMFYQYYGEYLPLGIDCSTFNVSQSSAYHAEQMFRYSYVKEVYDLKIPVQKSYNYFADACSNLTKIELLRSDENTTWTSAFNSCPNLAYLRIEGTIGKAFSVSGCNKLDHDSLMSIINALASITTTLTCTLGSTNLAKLTDAEKAIATEKGWTLA